VNWKDLGNNCCGLIEVLSRYFLEELWTPPDIPLRTGGIHGKIQTKFLKFKSLSPYQNSRCVCSYHAVVRVHTDGILCNI
jgi:hypothetical protein